MEDLISRRKALDVLKGLEFCRYIEVGEDIKEVRLIRAEKAQAALEQLPSEKPEERTMEEFMFGQDMGNPEDGSL